MAAFNPRQIVDLNSTGPQKIEQAYGHVGDAKAHQWDVVVVKGGAAFDLTGYTAMALVNNGSGTVNVTGTISGNVATAIFPAACYTEGVHECFMRITKAADSSEAITALMHLNVTAGETDTPLDPGTAITATLSGLLASEAARVEAETARASAETTRAAFYAGFNSQLAENASTLTALDEDAYGYVHKTPQKRLAAVESTIKSNKVVLEYTWEQGYFNTTTGAETVSGNAIRTGFIKSHDKQFINFEIAAGYRMFVYRYDTSKNFVSYSMIPGSTTDAVVGFDAAIGSGYYRLAMTKYDYASISVGAESNVVVSLFRSTFDQIQSRIAPVLFRDFGLGGRSNANQTGTTKMRVFPKFRSQDLVIAYSNYYKGTLNTPTANTNSITVKAAVEVNGVITPVFFGGKRSVVIEGGATILSDPVGVVIESTDTVFVRTYFDAGSGGYVPLQSNFFGSVAASPNKDGVVYGSDLCDSGTVTETSFTNVFTPTMILGVSDPWRKSYLLIGDSIMTVGGETIAPCAAFAARKLYARGIPHTKISMGGDSAVYFPNSLYVRAPFSKHHSGVICNYGANDLYGGLADLATMKARLKKIWAYYAKLGMTVYQCTITPNTTSTDLWMTLENQTSNNAAQETVRLALNAWLRDTSSAGAVAEAAGTLTGVLDVAATVETSGKWSVYTTPIRTGTVQSAGVNYIIDSGITAARAYDNTTVIKITGGTGAGQTRQVLNNATATQVYVNSNWTTQPDSTSTYEIYRVPTYDGVHPSMDAHGFMGAAINVPAF